MNIIFKSKDIDNLINGIVVSYINKGYHIYTNQNENLMFTNDTDIICIYKEYEYIYNEGRNLKIIVAKNDYDFKPYINSYSVFKGGFNKIINQFTFYEISEDTNRQKIYTSSKKFFNDCKEKQKNRTKKYQKLGRVFQNKNTISLAYKIAKNTKGFKSITKKDINSIYRLGNVYYITTNKGIIEKSF